LVALESFAEPVVLIAGGYDKGLDLSGFAAEAARLVKALVVMGRTGAAIADAALEANPALPVIRAANIKEAVRSARGAAEAGEVVLLSPACASYDDFENFAERGRRFAQEVTKLEEDGRGRT
ncbi:MAG: UDP-N-acetylmuramoyl-L-alanine--D-glutamate ligase, partial [Planctomycetes bacterium]|nr:UDP-N-acetylmuramoyl-L-alanine--D-glutamate ligase [Planctomycetota bacterium]